MPSERDEREIEEAITISISCIQLIDFSDKELIGTFFETLHM
jgi:hypothetical protein